MNPVQYIIADHTLGMSPGKLAAQCAHAAIEGLRLNAKEPWGNPWDTTIVNRWYQGGHHTKIVLQCHDLLVAERYLNERGFKIALIIDEGRTEFDGKLTPTAIGCPVLDKNQPHVAETFSVYNLYGTPEPSQVELPRSGGRRGLTRARGRFDAAKGRLLIRGKRPQRRPPTVPPPAPSDRGGTPAR